MTNLLNNDNISDVDRLRLVMLYALRYEKESPVQLMQLFNKLASRSPKYKPGVRRSTVIVSPFQILFCVSPAILVLFTFITCILQVILPLPNVSFCERVKEDN